MRISIFATHPIQYHVPWFVALSKRADVRVKVYFGHIPTDLEQGTGFDRSFKWDIPMFDGYDWQVLESKGRRPGSTGFFSNSTDNVVDLLKRDRPDVVILTGWQAFVLVQSLWACIRLRIPRLVRGESSSLKTRKPPVRLAHRLLLGQYDGFLVIGKANRQFYRNYGVPESKLFHCPYFVENDRLLKQSDTHRRERSRIRAGWNIPADSTCYLYVGKLTKKKRVMDQLAALEIALSSNPNLHLLIVGSGELMNEARVFTKARGLPVTFAGFLNQTEITSAYVAADCLVVSSDSDETWGLVANEAMVCGLPLIVSNRVGCSLDLIRNGLTGEIYPFGDVGALSKSMCTMASDTESMVRMGERAKQLVLHHHSPELAVSGTIKAAEAVLTREPLLAVR